MLTKIRRELLSRLEIRCRLRGQFQNRAVLTFCRWEQRKYAASDVVEKNPMLHRVSGVELLFGRFLHLAGLDGMPRPVGL